MRFARPLFLAKMFYRDALFRISTGNRSLVLTFDDGPDPASTPLLLTILAEKGLKAIFFCKGHAAEASPLLMKAIREAGHTVGNHGYEHLDGFSVSTDEYLLNADAAASLTSSAIFRPPYGRITPSQYRLVSSKYRVVMWDVMTYDFESGFTAEKSLNILRRKIRDGSVIALHDTSQSSSPLFLSGFIDYARSEGYNFIVPPHLSEQKPVILG